MEAREMLRTLRKRQGVSQDAVGLAVGRNGAAVSGWEAGLYRPRPATARLLDDFLHAEGELFAAFYPPVRPQDELVQRVSALEGEVLVLRQHVARLLDALDD